MKTHLRVALSAIIITPLLVVGVARAVEHDTATNQPATLSTEDKTAMQARLLKRKADLKTRLTNAEESKLKLKCKASQGHLSSLKGRIKGIDTSRNNVYRELVERLTKLQGKLNEQGVDTAALQTEIDALNTKITAFKITLADYKQAVSDLADMECATDPAAYKASLESARAAREKIILESAAIRAYVKDIIKPTLQQLRQQLDTTKKTTEGTN